MEDNTNPLDSNYIVRADSLPTIDTTSTTLPAYAPELPVDNNQLPGTSDSLTPNVSGYVANARSRAMMDMSGMGYNSFSSAVNSAFNNGKIKTSELTSLRDNHELLSDGETWMPKYKNYVQGFDNDEYNSSLQSGMEKFWNPIGRFGVKVARGIPADIASFVYGVGSAVANGRIESLFDNKFSNTLSDWDKETDFKYKDYFNDKESHLGFNMYGWDKVLSGTEFTARMIGSEALIELATGGLASASAPIRLGGKAASIAGRIERAGAESLEVANAIGTAERKALTSLAETGGKSGRLYGTTALEDMSTAINSRGKTFDVLKTLRYGITSSAQESGMEARNFREDAQNDFFESYRREGKEPTAEEVSKFYSKLDGTTDAVFGMNMAILSTANVAMFGKMFNIKNPISSFKLGELADRKLFGIGTKEVSKGNFEAISAGFFKKSLAYTTPFAKGALVEGVYEEGGQGIASGMMKNYIASTYDPKAMEQTSNYVDAFNKALKDQFSTKQGVEEVAIGALIGGLFGGVSGGVQTRNKYKSQDTVAKVQTSMVGASEAISNAIASNKTLASMLGHANREGGIDSRNADNKADDVKSALSSIESFVSMLQASHSVGKSDDFMKMMSATLNGMDVSKIASTFGINESEAEQFKKDRLGRIKSISESYAKSREAGEYMYGKSNIGGFFETPNGKVNRSNLVDGYAYASTMGDMSQKLSADAYSAFQEKLGELGMPSEVVEKFGAIAALRMAGKIQLEKFNQSKQKSNELTERKKQLEDELVQLQNSKEESEEKVSRVFAITKELQDISNEVESNRNDTSLLWTAIGNNFHQAMAENGVPKGQYLPMSVFDNFNKEAESLNSLVSESSFSESDKMQLGNMLDSFHRANDIYKSFAEISDGLSNPNFTYKTYAGIFSNIRAKGDKSLDELTKDTLIKIHDLGFKSKVKSEVNMDSFNNSDIVSDELVKAMNEDGYVPTGDILLSIYGKIKNYRKLTDNEQLFYDKFKDEVDNYANKYDDPINFDVSNEAKLSELKARQTVLNNMIEELKQGNIPEGLQSEFNEIIESNEKELEQAKKDKIDSLNEELSNKKDIYNTIVASLNYPKIYNELSNVNNRIDELSSKKKKTVSERRELNRLNYFKGFIENAIKENANTSDFNLDFTFKVNSLINELLGLQALDNLTDEEKDRASVINDALSKLTDKLFPDGKFDYFDVLPSIKKVIVDGSIDLESLSIEMGDTFNTNESIREGVEFFQSQIDRLEAKSSLSASENNELNSLNTLVGTLNRFTEKQKLSDDISNLDSQIRSVSDELSKNPNDSGLKYKLDLLNEFKDSLESQDNTYTMSVSSILGVNSDIEDIKEARDKAVNELVETYRSELEDNISELENKLNEERLTPEERESVKSDIAELSVSERESKATLVKINKLKRDLGSLDDELNKLESKKKLTADEKKKYDKLLKSHKEKDSELKRLSESYKPTSQEDIDKLNSLKVSLKEDDKKGKLTMTESKKLKGWKSTLSELNDGNLPESIQKKVDTVTKKADKEISDTKKKRVKVNIEASKKSNSKLFESKLKDLDEKYKGDLLKIEDDFHLALTKIRVSYEISIKNQIKYLEGIRDISRDATPESLNEYSDGDLIDMGIDRSLIDKKNNLWNKLNEKLELIKNLDAEINNLYDANSEKYNVSNYEGSLEKLHSDPGYIAYTKEMDRLGSEKDSILRTIPSAKYRHKVSKKNIAIAFSGLYTQDEIEANIEKLYDTLDKLPDSDSKTVYDKDSIWEHNLKKAQSERKEKEDVVKGDYDKAVEDLKNTEDSNSETAEESDLNITLPSLEESELETDEESPVLSPEENYNLTKYFFISSTKVALEEEQKSINLDINNKEDIVNKVQGIKDSISELKKVFSELKGSSIGTESSDLEKDIVSKINALESQLRDLTSENKDSEYPSTGTYKERLEWVFNNISDLKFDSFEQMLDYVTPTQEQVDRFKDLDALPTRTKEEESEYLLLKDIMLNSKFTEDSDFNGESLFQLIELYKYLNEINNNDDSIQLDDDKDDSDDDNSDDDDDNSDNDDNSDDDSDDDDSDDSDDDDDDDDNTPNNDGPSDDNILNDVGSSDDNTSDSDDSDDDSDNDNTPNDGGSGDNGGSDGGSNDDNILNDGGSGNDSNEPTNGDSNNTPSNELGDSNNTPNNELGGDKIDDSNNTPNNELGGNKANDSNSDNDSNSGTSNESNDSTNTINGEVTNVNDKNNIANSGESEVVKPTTVTNNNPKKIQYEPSDTNKDDEVKLTRRDSTVLNKNESELQEAVGVAEEGITSGGVTMNPNYSQMYEGCYVTANSTLHHVSFSGIIGWAKDKGYNIVFEPNALSVDNSEKGDKMFNKNKKVSDELNSMIDSGASLSEISEFCEKNGGFTMSMVKGKDKIVLSKGNTGEFIKFDKPSFLTKMGWKSYNITGVNGKYSMLYQKDTDGIWRPRPSDFKVSSNGVTIPFDTNQLFGLKPNSKVTLFFSNIDDYNKTLKPSEYAEKGNIYIMSGGKLIGIVKSAKAFISSSNEDWAKLKEVRSKVVKEGKVQILTDGGLIGTPALKLSSGARPLLTPLNKNNTVAFGYVDGGKGGEIVIHGPISKSEVNRQYLRRAVEKSKSRLPFAVFRLGGGNLVAFPINVLPSKIDATSELKKAIAKGDVEVIKLIAKYNVSKNKESVFINYKEDPSTIFTLFKNVDNVINHSNKDSFLENRSSTFLDLSKPFSGYKLRLNLDSAIDEKGQGESDSVIGSFDFDNEEYLDDSEDNTCV